MRKEDLLQKIDVGTLYRRLLPLPIKETGRDWITVRCPLHNDTAPSLSVNLRHGGFQCHAAACGKSGDIFTFYMELLGVDFKTALKEISEMHNLVKP